jgi:hypothetical protein
MEFRKRMAVALEMGRQESEMGKGKRREKGSSCLFELRLSHVPLWLWSSKWYPGLLPVSASHRTVR